MISEKELFDKWHSEGFKAGKKEKVIVIDKESLKDTFKRFGAFDTAYDLVNEEFYKWEDLDYFWDKYGDRMLADLIDFLGIEDDNPGAMRAYFIELKNQFWSGYLKGRGINIYKIAEEVIEEEYY